MLKVNSLSPKVVVSSALVSMALSVSVYATELLPVSDLEGPITIQCIENAGQKLCCTGGPGNMTCEWEKV